MRTHDTALAKRLEVLETERAVRGVIARYFELCDDLGPHTLLEELANLFTSDALWEGLGRYHVSFGSYCGRAAIAAMLDSYCRPSAHFAMTAHFLSSERILVAESSASGRWMMLQTSTYADGRADLRSAELNVHFAYEDNAWRIARFQTRNLFSRRVSGWSDEKEIPVPQNLSSGN